jgi:hypothetical protein
MLGASCKAEKSGGAMEEQHWKFVSHCVGRSVIGIPETFAPTQIITGQFKTTAMKREDESIELLVRAGGLTSAQFQTEVAQVRNEIAQRTSGKVDVLRLERVLDDQTVLFRVQEIDDAYKSKIVLLRDGNVIHASLESFNNKFAHAEDLLLAFAKSIKSVTHEQSPAPTNGFCLGAIEIFTDLTEEAALFRFSDGEGSTLGFDLDTYTADEEIPLLKRVSGPDSLLAMLKVHHRVLRAGERTVAGMRAQEWLGWAQTGETEEKYAFALETMRSVPGKNTPRIHLSLDTGQRLANGKQPRKTMSAQEAINLWDSVVGSIRLTKG